MNASSVTPNVQTALAFMEAHLAQRRWFAGEHLSLADFQMSFAVEAALAHRQYSQRLAPFAGLPAAHTGPPGLPAGAGKRRAGADGTVMFFLWLQVGAGTQVAAGTQVKSANGHHASRTSSIPPCKACQDRPPLTIDFSMAFQPIIDVRSREVFPTKRWCGAWMAVARPTSWAR